MSDCVLAPEPGVVTAHGTRPPAAPRPSSALRPFHVIVLGDSLAAGDDGMTAVQERWSVRARDTIQAARPDRDVVITNSGLPGSAIEYVEQTVAILDAFDYQIAIIVEGRNDYLSEAAWSPRYVRVIQALERQGILVILGTIPPILSKGVLLGFSRNPCIRLVAGTTRPLLDFEARWNAAGPEVASGWYSDAVHASVAGQVVEGEMAATLLLGLMK